ncbi:hypothetical protein DBR11_14170 [Pedobacter sp. HMWF019]|uniref:hypothetical protein n=1 Tax=Pedobacter sp. HMWF019 TaxID=2056856 RepID=UPI000D3B0F6F|nr:hypothetical protein [Pedobacter sp. HMWF019]PTS98692.1 hypothetical protein DBR11_14170 [Pedobacter sp. HMWF019]
MDSNSVQPVNHFFFDNLDTCCQKIIEKMGDKPITEWRSADYNSLSSRLGKQTKVYLSENTLKRIFGRLKTPQRYFPQKATRDALAQFIGYRDWQEFEKIDQVSKPQPGKSGDPGQNIETELPVLKEKKRPYLLMGLLFVLLMVTIFGAIFWEREYTVPDVNLICENPFGSVPHTAVFKLTSKTNFDKNKEFQVDFLDEAQRTDINGDRKITKFFRNPGVVYATLLYHNKPIDTTAVFLLTKGWVANSGNDTSRAFPIAGLKPLNSNNIYVSPKQLDSAGLDISKPFLIGFSNVKPSNISGDNFSFSCKVFAEQSRPGIQCIETTIIILGEKHRHLLKLFRKSCIAFSEYKFSENRRTGSEQFLGALAFDPEHGGTVGINIENKKVAVILNGKKVLSTKYERSVGKVMGIKILFNGIGKIISPELKDLKTGEIY